MLIWVQLSNCPFILPIVSIETIGGMPFIVTPAIRPSDSGVVTLRDKIDFERNELNIEAVFCISFAIAFGLQQAAKTVPGLIHGDIKPQNILMTGDFPLIADFGLSRTTGVVNRGKTTLAYLAPECWHGGALTTQSDVYAFGCVLAELLTGNHPFGDNINDPVRLEQLHRTRTIEFSKRGERDFLQRGLESVVLCCTSKLASDRPPSMSEVMRSLAKLGDQFCRPVVARVLYAAAHLTQLEEQNSFILEERVMSLLERAKPAEALIAINGTSHPLSSAMMRLKGTALSLTGCDDQAIIMFERALKAETEPDSIILCKNELGLSLNRLGRYDEARALFGELMGSAPKSREPMVMGNYARVLIDGGDPTGAVEITTKTLRAHNREPKLWALLGEAQQVLGDLEEALTSYGRAAALAPDEGLYKVRRAKILLEDIGAIEEALATLDQVYAQGHHSSEWLELTLISNILLGRGGEVEVLRSQLVQQLDPDTASAMQKRVVERAIALMRKFVAAPSGGKARLPPAPPLSKMCREVVFLRVFGKRSKSD